MVGDTSDAVWGVMDIYPRTNFPDIRRKTTIHSSHGSILVIPREGGSLVRFYIEFPSGTNVKDVKLEDLHEKARQIFSPYTMEYADTYWWSCYCIGQRLADHFTKDNRVFPHRRCFPYAFAKGWSRNERQHAGRIQYWVEIGNSA